MLSKLVYSRFGYLLDKFVIRWGGPSLALLYSPERANSPSPWNVLILVAIGRKSGQKRAVPLPYCKVGDRMFIVGSKMGSPKDPAWVQNLRSDPDVEIYLKARKRKVHARFTSGAERAELWAALERYPIYRGYQEKAGDRELPLIVLESRQA